MLKSPLPRGSSVCVALCLLALPGFAADEKAPSANAMTIADHWSLPGILGGGVKTNDAYTDGNLFLTFPAYSTIGTNGSLGGDVIFIEPYSSWGEQGEVAVSLGLGWRHLFSQQSTSAVTNHDGHQAGFFEEGAFIGANLFVDLLDTQFDNRFWQLGFGLEAGTRYLELHANYYLPLSERQLALEQRSRQTFASRSTSIQRDVAYGDPYATGHTISQEALFTTTRTTVTTNTTIDRISRLFEDGMEGWEIEAALLVPGLDRWMDVKILGGYYSYDNQPFGPQAGGTGNVEGWKAGLEVRPVPAVVLNATWYEDERLTGSDWVAGVRFELPFEAGDLGDGKGFWGRIGDAFRPRRRHLAERLIEPVRRQNAAVKIASSVEEEQKVTQTQHVTKVVNQTANQIVLANTVVFVDNAIGSPTNPGTYEAPLDTIQHGENLGNSTFGDNAILFVQGRSSPYNENVILSQGVRLYGSGSFPALGGRVFTGRASTIPLLIGGITGQDISATVEIRGFDLAPALNDVVIAFTSVENIVIAGNRFTHPLLGGAIDIRSLGSAVSHALISDNSFSGGNGTVSLSAEDSSTLVAVVDRNTISGNVGVGIGMLTSGTANGRFMVRDNYVSGNGPFGIWGWSAQASSGSYVLSGNTVIKSFFHDRAINLRATETARASFALVDNVIANSGGEGLLAQTSAGAESIYFLNGNTFLNNGMIHGEPQIKAENLGIMIFNAGPDSNTIIKSLLAPHERYQPGFLGPSGFIFINGVLYPASVTVP